MNHLSFYWLPDNQQLFIESLETEFAELVEQSINTGKISLPPISEVVLKIQKLCSLESTGISDIANCLLEDPGLAAIVLKVANSVIFNRGNVTCKDLNTAVSRLGILRVRDIVTAQSIELLKHSVNLTEECKDVLVQSAAVSRELAATMVMVTQAFQDQAPTSYQYLEQEKCLHQSRLHQNWAYSRPPNRQYLGQSGLLTGVSNCCLTVSPGCLDHT